MEAHQEDIKLAAALEKRIAGLVERHATHVRCLLIVLLGRSLLVLLQVDALSELFVAWDDILAETENKVTKLERDREERRRLGYD